MFGATLMGEMPSGMLARYIKILAAIVGALIIGSLAFIWHEGFSTITAKDVLTSAIPACAILSSALWASWFALQAIETQRTSAARSAQAAKDSAVKSAEAAQEVVKIQQQEARKTATLQETLDLILRTELDAEFIQAKKTWGSRNRFSSENGSSENSISALVARCHYGTNATDRDFEDSVLIRMFFNNFETIALAIDMKIIDEDFYVRWQRSAFINTWNDAAEVIGVMRGLASNQKLYCEWEKLVERWANNGALRQVARPPEIKTAELVRLAGLVAPHTTTKRGIKHYILAPTKKS